MIEKLKELLARPVPQHRMELGAMGYFDPWDLFPALYGSYDQAFDDCALDVLRGMRDRRHDRNDLASDMFREMLCTAGLCEYGTSPRACFPDGEFRDLLPALIVKWEAYAATMWEGDE